MDYTKLDTMDCLTAGVLNRPKPKTKMPADFNGEHVSEGEWTKKTLLAGLEKGGLSASMYYGCWDIWKTDKGFSGELVQYRNITDSFEDKLLDYALDKATKWASCCEG